MISLELLSLALWILERDRPGFVRRVVIEPDNFAAHLYFATHCLRFFRARFPHHAGTAPRVTERIDQRLNDAAAVAVVTLRDERVLDRAA